MVTLETLMSSYNIIFQFLFHPLLWAIPFAILICLSLHKILTNGIYSRFDVNVLNFEVGHIKRIPSSLNVLLFAVLWLVAINVFTLLGFNEITVVYLCFVTIFSAYGTSEFLARIIWFRTLVGEFGFIPVLKGMMHPIYFLLNHIPLYMFLKDYTILPLSFYLFWVLQAVHFILFVIHGYKAVIQQKRKHVIKSYYYVCRTIAILSYCIILFGMIKL